jgi:hypothetical protein
VPEPPTSPVTSANGVTQLLAQHDMELDQENEDPLLESPTSPLCSWDPSPVRALSNALPEQNPQQPCIAVEASGLLMSPPLLQSAPPPPEVDAFGPFGGAMTFAELGLLGGSMGPSLSFTE